MDTGFNLREGSAMLTRRFGVSEFWGVFDQLGAVYAIRETRQEAEEEAGKAALYLDEAATCGHPSAPAWAKERLPLIVRSMTLSERAAALEDSVPILDREP